MSDLEEIVIDGEPRKMGRLPPDENALMKRAGMMSFAEHLDAKGLTLIPRDKWISRGRKPAKEMVLNQGQFGACFPKGTRIRMADGSERLIENVRLLDKVVTAERRIGRVIETMVRDEKESLIRVHLCGHKHLRLTAEHPILTKRGYVAAGKLKIGDWIAMPKYMASGTKCIHTVEHVEVTRFTIRTERRVEYSGVVGRASAIVVHTPLPDVIHLTPGFGRIVGLFLSEGHTDSHKTTWTFSDHERDTFVAELVGLLKSELGVEPHIQLRPANHSIAVKLHGKPWAKLFESLCSTGAGKKRLHPDLTSSPVEFQEAMLSGWLDGDGYERRTTTQGVTISHDLAMSMYDIAQALGYRPTVRLSHPKPGKGVATRRSRWDIEWGNSGRGKQTKTHVWRKCQGIVTEEFQGPVYNLHVEGDNSYVAEGIGVHNCVGFSAAGANMWLRKSQGMSFNRLSGAFVYAHINNNRDNGAIITEAMATLESDGICLESEFNIPNIYERQIPASAKETAKRFRLGKAFTIATFDEMGTLLTMGFFPQFPVQVGKTFQRFNAEGVSGVDQGQGNHSVMAIDIVRLSDGTPTLLMQNSWGMWGPFSNGTVLLSEAHIEGCAVGDDAYVHVWDIQDPNDPNNPPEIV